MTNKNCLYLFLHKSHPDYVLVHQYVLPQMHIK